MLLEVVQKCPLFAGIDETQLNSLFSCLNAKETTYQKEEFVFRVDEPAAMVGVVLSGSVNVVQEDFWGNRTILTHVGPAELFGEAFSCAEIDRFPVSAVATETSVVLLLDYRKIITVCSPACVFHATLISNMLRLLANKNILLTRKIEYMSKRTTQEKVLSFLSAQAVQAKSKEVVIPFNRQELADYLGVERSALSRVLMKMKKEGLLEYEKNWFLLK